MNYANQTSIKIKALGEIEHEYNSPEQYLAALNWNELLNVMSDLEPAEFVLWQYLLKWRGGEAIYNFSPIDLKVQFGWSENSSRKYKKSLENKGYLVKTSSKTFDFIPYPECVESRAALKREKNRNLCK